jgi:hypothetical protein
MTVTPGDQEWKRIYLAAPGMPVFWRGGMRDPEVEVGGSGSGVPGMPYVPQDLSHDYPHPGIDSSFDSR